MEHETRETNEEVTSMEKIVPVKSILDMAKHMVFKAVYKGVNRVLREKNGRVLPASIWGVVGPISSKGFANGKGVA
ncbi:hypothetical protein V6N13_008177 [Hibiscus sabdariffa]